MLVWISICKENHALRAWREITWQACNYIFGITSICIGCCHSNTAIFIFSVFFQNISSKYNSCFIDNFRAKIFGLIPGGISILAPARPARRFTPLARGLAMLAISKLPKCQVSSSAA